MSYTTSGITYLGSEPYDSGRIVRALTSHTDKIIQCYVSGHLTAWCEPIDGRVEFVLADAKPTDIFFLLAVDPDQAETDYWSVAFGESQAHGNRIKIRTPQIMGYAAQARWKVYRGDAGDVSADELLCDREFYPGSRRAGGFAIGQFGYGGFGWDGSDAAGFGYNFGYGQFGFDCQMLEQITETLPPGEYPIEVIVADEHGNESDAYETTVTLDTYPRPAGDLDIDSYNSGADELKLTWTQSEDIT